VSGSNDKNLKYQYIRWHEMSIGNLAQGLLYSCVGNKGEEDSGFYSRPERQETAVDKNGQITALWKHSYRP
jgi:aminopeptidase-like protein